MFRPSERLASSADRNASLVPDFAPGESMTTTRPDAAAQPLTQETREEFIARMSDELLTPLNAVIGFSRLLEKNRAGNQRTEDLDLLRRVRASGEHLLQLVTRVLEQARIARGDLAIALRPTDVSAIALNVAAEYRGPAIAKGLRLITIIPDSMPIMLDAERFEEIMRHVIDNAVKFTTSGVIRVVMALDIETRRPRRVTIADEGIGIAPERLEAIFEPFEQADVGAQRSYRGLGLGLALARALAESMGCRLTVTSELAKGSRFTIHFPRTTSGARQDD
jgi:signal transduction histidine kinase